MCINYIAAPNLFRGAHPDSGNSAEPAAAQVITTLEAGLLAFGNFASSRVAASCIRGGWRELVGHWDQCKES